MGADDTAPFEARELYSQLHAIAEREFRREPANHVLQATALVNEAWIRLADRQAEFKSRSHFLGFAAKTMRHVLVDHARSCRSQKRGGNMARVTLTTADGQESEGPRTDILDLHDALQRLEQIDEKLARVVELRFFAGMTIKEVAESLGVSHMTVSNHWSRARVWLARELGG